MGEEKIAGLGMTGIRRGIGTYIKNMSHMGVNKAQKELNTFTSSPFPKMPNGAAPTRSSYPDHINQLQKNLHNAKVSHNLTVAGTAATATAAAAGVGGYAAYQKSTNPEVNDLMQQNQASQQNQFAKSASEELDEIIHGNLIDRLEKTAAIAYVPVEVPDQGDQEDVAAAQSAEVAPLPQPSDPTQPGDPSTGSGIDPNQSQGAGVDPAQIGVTQEDEQQEGPVDGAIHPAVNPEEGDPSSAVEQGPVMNGTQPITPESQELQAILAAQQAERQQESVPGYAESGNPRQGAGSVSNAPAGEDKTAAELYARLEKTAEEQEQKMRYQTIGEMSPTAKGVLGGIGAGSLAAAGIMAGEDILHNPAAMAAAREIDPALLPAIGGGLGGWIGMAPEAFKKVPVDNHQKQAESLVERLEKTATAAGRVGQFIDDFSGKSVNNWEKHLKDAKRERVEVNRGVRNEYPQPEAVAKGEKNLADAKKRQGKAIGSVAGGALVAGGTAAGVAAHEHHKKTAEEDLYDRLEKTAGRAGGFVDDLLGKNVNRLQGHLNNVKKERESVNGLIHTKYPQPEAVAKGEKNLADAKKRHYKALGATTGVGAAAGGVGGYAAQKHHDKNKQEKTAGEDLFDRLTKTAAEAYTVDNSPMGGKPGDKEKQDKNFWHKLSPAEVQEEDQTEPNGQQKALYEKLTLTSGGYDSASQAANLSKKAEEGEIDPDHDGDDDRPGSKNNPDKADDDKAGVTTEAAKEEKEKGQEKKAFEIPGLGGLVERAGGALKNGLGAAGEYAGNVTGSTYRGAKATATEAQQAFNHNQALLNKYNTPEALMQHGNPETGVGVAKFRQNLEQLDANRAPMKNYYDEASGAADEAKKSMLKAQGITAGVAGVGLAGMGAGAHMAHPQNQADQPMEQTASEEDLMNGLFKEAAAMIINEEIPEVKQHVDIMDRIKF